MNALLFERPIWFATGPLELEEKAEEMEDITYHRPVLVTEAVELLAPRAGALVVDATCGGGGHTEEILRTGADVLAFDQDPDAIAHASERLTPYGGRVTLRQINFRNAAEVLDQLGIVGIGGALLDLGVSSRQLKMRSAVCAANGLRYEEDPRRELTGRATSSTLTTRRADPALPRGGEETARRIAIQLVKLADHPLHDDELAKAGTKIVLRKKKHGRSPPRRFPGVAVEGSKTNSAPGELARPDRGWIRRSHRGYLHSFLEDRRQKFLSR